MIAEELLEYSLALRVSCMNERSPSDVIDHKAQLKQLPRHLYESMISQSEHA